MGKKSIVNIILQIESQYSGYIIHKVRVVSLTPNRGISTIDKIYFRNYIYIYIQ